MKGQVLLLLGGKKERCKKERLAPKKARPREVLLVDDGIDAKMTVT
tara:strand:+ start:1421 stop:1558 length:138 start_codon:yes stop_codon:yes gene_type:complete